MHIHTYHAPGTVFTLNNCDSLNLIFVSILWGKYYNYPHFTDEKPRRRHWVTRPRPHLSEWQTWGYSGYRLLLQITKLWDHHHSHHHHCTSNYHHSKIYPELTRHQACSCKTSFYSDANPTWWVTGLAHSCWVSGCQCRQWSQVFLVPKPTLLRTLENCWNWGQT